MTDSQRAKLIDYLDYRPGHTTLGFAIGAVYYDPNDRAAMTTVVENADIPIWPADDAARHLFDILEQHATAAVDAPNGTDANLLESLYRTCKGALDQHVPGDCLILLIPAGEAEDSPLVPLVTSACRLSSS